MSLFLKSQLIFLKTCAIFTFVAVNHVTWAALKVTSTNQLRDVFPAGTPTNKQTQNPRWWLTSGTALLGTGEVPSCSLLNWFLEHIGVTAQRILNGGRATRYNSFRNTTSLKQETKLLGFCTLSIVRYSTI
jgi:hypothetical protein